MQAPPFVHIRTGLRSVIAFIGWLECVLSLSITPVQHSFPYLGCEQHFMTKMGADSSADERYVDVFRGGVLLTRCAVPTMQAPSVAPCCRAWQLSQLFHSRKRIKSQSLLQC